VVRIPRCWRPTFFGRIISSSLTSTTTLSSSPFTVAKSIMSDTMASATATSSHSLDLRGPSSSHNNHSNSSTSLKEPSSRHSPVAPLAPLEYLQNQRRGSITDPSLHAAVPKPLNSNHTNISRQPETSASGVNNSPGPHDSAGKNGTADSRPNSSYVFGEASNHGSDNHNQQIRKLLRSPSSDHYNQSPSALSRQEPQGSHEASSRNLAGSSEPAGVGGSDKINDGDPMNIDGNDRHEQSPHLSIDQGRQATTRDSQFDYNMRRHSIAVGHDLHAPNQPHSGPHGTKRKMSSDRNVFATVSEEIDPQLVGPGVPSSMNMDSEAPAPKRRGSAIDHRGLGQLSLYDRRNSVDSRGGGMWVNDRRDSSSIFSSIYSSGFPGESPHGRPPPGIATYSWPATSPDQAGAATMQNEPDSNMAGPRTFDPHTSHLTMMHPITFASDRRMSVSDSVPPNTAGPTRVLRSRSRPPSRQLRSADPTSEHQSGPSSASNATPEDLNSAPSPTGSAKLSKDSGATPYSRSPELRVSHKLAERKRRKEMKELFDELRDQLPADRGMKASKWEILSKAIDFVNQLKQNHQDMAREIDMLRHELDNVRQGGMPQFPPGGPVVYGQPPVLSGQYPPPPTGTVQQHPPPPHPHPPISRPGSSQNSFPPGGPGAPPPALNGNMTRSEAPPT
jgi:hypothetical protein